jgi:peptidoglycan/xylan/chitin deacetylase (PgdA/CDA1 family)
MRVLRRTLPIALVACVLTLPEAGNASGRAADDIDPDTADCNKVRCVALTFDDGPGPYTSKLLWILQSYRAKATFFEIGERIAEHPEWSRNVVKAGMLVGVHTWSHPYMTLQSLPEARQQLIKAMNALQKATGAKATVYRPPAGLSTPEILKIEGELGLSEILWNVVAYDWEHSAQPELTIAAVHQYAQPGAVFLLHDVHEGTVQAMAEAVPWLKRQGYVLVTVDRLIRAKTGSGPKPGQRYWNRDSGQLDPAKQG